MLAPNQIIILVKSIFLTLIDAGNEKNYILLQVLIYHITKYLVQQNNTL